MLMKTYLDPAYWAIRSPWLSEGADIQLEKWNIIQYDLLLPKYSSQMIKVETITNTVSIWNEDAKETLKGCFEEKERDVFLMNVQIILKGFLIHTEDILFCEENITPTKTVIIHSKMKSGSPRT